MLPFFHPLVNIYILHIIFSKAWVKFYLILEVTQWQKRTFIPNLGQSPPRHERL